MNLADQKHFVELAADKVNPISTTESADTSTTDIFARDRYKRKPRKVKGLNQDEDVKLPVVFSEREIMENIENNIVTIVCGETGSGKST